jgi:type I site-specific restriction endonuclease
VLRAGRRFQDEKRITITTLQSMVNLYAEYSSGYFDLVISDECHRSIYGQWSGVLRHFDGVQVGLTATPCVSDAEDTGDDEDKAFVRDTLRFFEVDAPTFSYKLKTAIRDGYLVPYQIYKAQTVKTAAEGGFEVKKAELDWSAMDAETRGELEELFGDKDTITVNPSALERRFTIPERNRAIVREYRQVLDKGYIDAKGVLRKPLLGKAIVFAVTKKHAETLARLFDAEFAHLKHVARRALRRLRVQRPGRRRYGRWHEQDSPVQEGAVPADPGLGEHARHRLRLPGGGEPGLRALHALGHPVPADARPRHPQGAQQADVHDVRLRRRFGLPRRHRRLR